MQWHIGCSGFSYKEWKNTFYPPQLPQREWFAYYASVFPTVELNVSFYRFPQLKMMQNWYIKSPRGFLFAVKAPRLITHLKKLNDCEELLKDFYNVCREGLKEKLGPVLFQFPPSYQFTEERLAKIISSADPQFTNVIEFRHESWWKKEVYDAFKESNLIFCGESYPNLPDEAIVTAPVAYYRFHGIPALYYSEYDIAYLKKTADDFLKHKELKEVYCFFNNTAALGAIANAQWMGAYINRQ